MTAIEQIRNVWAYIMSKVVSTRVIPRTRYEIKYPNDLQIRPNNSNWPMTAVVCKKLVVRQQTFTIKKCGISRRLVSYICIFQEFLRSTFVEITLILSHCWQIFKSTTPTCYHIIAMHVLALITVQHFTLVNSKHHA